MASQIKIDQNTPPIDVKDKTIQKPANRSLTEIKLKSKEPIENSKGTIEIDTENIIDSSQVKIKSKGVDNQELVLRKKEDEKDKKTGLDISNEKLKKIKDATNKVLAQLNIQLDFTFDKQLKKIIVKVINKETGEVIRQIPPEEMLKIAKRMEEMVGVLLDKWS